MYFPLPPATDRSAGWLLHGAHREGIALRLQGFTERGQIVDVRAGPDTPAASARKAMARETSDSFGQTCGRRVELKRSGEVAPAEFQHRRDVMLLLIIIVLAVLFLGGGGGYYYRSGRNRRR
jgi:hypothetical protein